MLSRYFSKDRSQMIKDYNLTGKCFNVVLKPLKSKNYVQCLISLEKFELVVIYTKRALITPEYLPESMIRLQYGKFVSARIKKEQLTDGSYRFVLILETIIETQLIIVLKDDDVITAFKEKLSCNIEHDSSST